MRFKLGRLSNYVYLRNLPIENGQIGRAHV